MVEIGQNLKYTQSELHDFSDTSMTLRDASNKTVQIDFGEVEKVELAGIKSGSGFSGTMEWGMGNPTFLLPTNLFYNIINLFKRRDDDVYFKVLLKDGKIFLVRSKKSNFSAIQQSIEK